MKDNATFTVFDWSRGGLLFDDSRHQKYPLRYFALVGHMAWKVEPGRSYFLYVVDGPVRLVRDLEHGDAGGYGFHVIQSGMYCSFEAGPRTELTTFKNTRAVLIEVLYDYRSYFTIGGPIERHGRLKYIDGCTDSLLIPPIKKGDPCLNHLHFPKEIVQTQHTHPSHRIGVVTKGEGECITPFGNTPLRKGDIFIIKEYDGVSTHPGEFEGVKKDYPGGQHSFFTYDDEMDVIAFHPDSDFGPEDDEHPMINRTIVDGKSAKDLDDIRTK